MKHIYDWLDIPPKNRGEGLVKEWLEKFAKPPHDKDYEYLNDRLPSCEYNGERWYIGGCSRMGDIWLKKSDNPEMYYDIRVDVEECTEWQCKHLTPFRVEELINGEWIRHTHKYKALWEAKVGILDMSGGSSQENFRIKRIF